MQKSPFHSSPLQSYSHCTQFKIPKCSYELYGPAWLLPCPLASQSHLTLYARSISELKPLSSFQISQALSPFPLEDVCINCYFFRNVFFHLHLLLLLDNIYLILLSSNIDFFLHHLFLFKFKLFLFFSTLYISFIPTPFVIIY